jgi:hypothetical protein
MNPTSSQIGFSRVVAPATQMNGGFSRLSYEMNGVELNGNRKLKRWFRKNAPLSYIGAGLGALLIVDAVTGGKVTELVMPKKKRR